MFGKSKSKSTSAKKLSKAEKKGEKKAEKKAEKKGEGRSGVLHTVTDPKTAKRTIAVAKIAGPYVAPYALRAATGARGYLDNMRAQKLGVSPDDVAAYRGPTGPAKARIAGLGQSLDDLRRRHSADLPAVRFTDVSRTRLADLAAAVTAAASMPAGRRRAALNAVNRDLNQIDADLLTFLVGSAA